MSQQKYNRLQSNRNDSSIANRYLRADSRPECIMSWRIVVISKRAKLDYQLGYLVVRNEEVTKIHLSEISTILIESTAATVTTSLLAELTKKKIKVIFCDEKRNPSSELVGYYGSHDTSNKIRKQIQWSRHSKEAIWTEIVTEKILSLIHI